MGYDPIFFARDGLRGELSFRGLPCVADYRKAEGQAFSGLEPCRLALKYSPEDRI